MNAIFADGKIEPDDEIGRLFGFTADKFDGWLWLEGRRVYVSFIISKQQGKGHLSELFDAIEGRGFEVLVPTPLEKMQRILLGKGFVPAYENSEHGQVEVWCKPRHESSAPH